MKGNQTLASYDMVLALSENTINFQFQELHKRNIIHKKWGLLVGKQKVGKVQKDFHITEQEANFKQKLNRWTTLQQKIKAADEADDFEDVSDLRKVIREENINFDFGWDANLEAPTISIIQNDTKNVTLQIRFKSGKLYYRPDKLAAVQEFNLKGLVYAFNVPIGKLTVNKSQMILNAGNEVKKIIRESGLTEQDFTIESLFLNFQNANIATFIPNKSKLPKDAVLPFKIAIENYFNVILHEDEHPYVLGYSVQRKRIKASEKAMFQPTSLNFSTSFSNYNGKQGVFSALNFLMMLNDTKPPSGTTAGILPKSLIELEKDASSTTDGVFAIQGAHFAHYFDSLDDYVETTFKNLENVELKHGFQNNEMVLTRNDKHVDDTIDTTYTITKEAVKNNGDASGMTIRYKIKIHVKIIVRAWFVKVGEKTLSTSGTYTKDQIKTQGEPGYLDFTIKAGKTGRFDLIHKLTEPKIAFDKNPNLFGNGFWADLLKILSLIVAWVFVIIEAIVNQIAVDLGKKGASESNKLIEKLNNIDVLNQTNKVILPLGKVYAFKNLRMEKTQDVVAYDISYAPVIEK